MAVLDIKEIETLIELFARSSLTELTFERGDARLTLKRDRAGEPVTMALPAQPTPTRKSSASEAPVNSAPPAAPSGRESVVAVPTTPTVANGYPIKSPIVGTFYRRPSPEAKPYVELGSQVALGDTLCVVEAMKVMNEIKADRAGRVVQIVAAEGQHVEYGQTLIILDLAAQPSSA